jgi:D-aminoacyl-tRNA deacylase
MRAVVQRVADASVEVGTRETGRIGGGFLVLLGISVDDEEADARWMADKVANLRVFADEQHRMNRSLLDEGGEALVVSQFTLYGDARKGRRPSFVRAAQGTDAERLYDLFCDELRALRIRTATGEFGAIMRVSSTNDGPVTILLDSDRAL